MTKVSDLRIYLIEELKMSERLGTNRLYTLAHVRETTFFAFEKRKGAISIGARFFS